MSKFFLVYTSEIFNMSFKSKPHVIMTLCGISFDEHLYIKSKKLCYFVFLSAYLKCNFDNFSKSSGDWVCGKDNTDMYMSQTGYIRCNAASRHYCSNDLNSWHHIDKISNWRSDCGMHGSHPFQKYIEADKTAFILSMSMALQMVKNKGRARWIAALVLELGKQYGYVSLLRKI